VSSEKQKPVERLVERILSAKQRDAGADVSASERELDEFVSAQFGVTAVAPRDFLNLIRPKT
jgi:hypothetical protein